MIKNNKELNAHFREAFPELDFKKIRDYAGTGKMYKTDTRCAFVDYIDTLSRNGQINESLANSAHLI